MTPLKFSKLTSGRQDIILAALLLFAVFMMIIPLPTIVVDFLVAINLMFSIVLLMISIYIEKPSEFSVFPGILLITTLYRLALTVSTSRLILLNHDAGEIVYTFGKFAVGGNVVVGLIVFAIITIIQFIVITKGAERVAEVSARFSLDAMPGKQMSIDGDMRAGIIDSAAARIERISVQKESQLYGAMDGAMKFVKGDAIASIIVILVNILGGIAVGVFMHGMSAGEAASIYTILSVGDGLIAQIPALLISISAGIIVTRIPNEVKTNLGKEISGQLLKYRQALWLVSFFLLFFALLPGFPKPVFITLAVAVFICALYMSKKDKNGDNGSALNEISSGAGHSPLSVHLSSDYNLSSMRDNINSLITKKSNDLGVPFPDVNVSSVKTEEKYHARLSLYNEEILNIAIPPFLMICPESGKVEQSDFEYTLPFTGLVVQWVSLDRENELLEQNLNYIKEPGDCLIKIMSMLLSLYAPELIGIQETRFIMDGMEANYGELVKEIQRQLPVQKIADILKRMISENIPITNLRSIFESLVEWAPREKDPLILLEYARVSIRRYIVNSNRSTSGYVNVWFIDEVMENMIRESIRQTISGSFSTLTEDDKKSILTKVDKAIVTNDCVIIASLDVRRYLRKIIEDKYYYTPVLSHQEIADEARVNVLGNINMEDDNATAM